MPVRNMDREQMWLLPPSLDELVPLDHPAGLVAEFVDDLDREEWQELGVAIKGAPLGAPAYHPRALLSVWLYGFMPGVRSAGSWRRSAGTRYPICGLPGGNTRTTHSVAVLPEALPKHAETVQTNCAHCPGLGPGRSGDTGSGRYQGGCQRFVQSGLRRCGAGQAVSTTAALKLTREFRP